MPNSNCSNCGVPRMGDGSGACPNCGQEGKPKAKPKPSEE